MPCYCPASLLLQNHSFTGTFSFQPDFTRGSHRTLALTFNRVCGHKALLWTPARELYFPLKVLLELLHFSAVFYVTCCKWWLYCIKQNKIIGVRQLKNHVTRCLSPIWRKGEMNLILYRSPGVAGEGDGNQITTDGPKWEIWYDT